MLQKYIQSTKVKKKKNWCALILSKHYPHYGLQGLVKVSLWDCDRATLLFMFVSQAKKTKTPESRAVVRSKHR